MTVWEWVVLMVVFSLVSTLEAIVVISVHMTAKIRLEQARRGR